MHRGGAGHGGIGHHLHQPPTGETGHGNGAHRAGAEQHQICIEELVDGDAGIEEAIAEAQLQKHQDAGEGDPR